MLHTEAPHRKAHPEQSRASCRDHPVSSVYLRLALALAFALLLGGCGTRKNRGIELVKRIDLSYPFSPNAVALQGNLLFGANGRDMIVLDVSDPLNPQRIASYVPEPMNGESRSVRGIAVNGDHAYLAANGLVIVDISDPSSPTGLYTYDLDKFPRDIEVRDEYVYLAGQESGLLIMDVSDPTQPKLVSQVAIADRGWSTDGVHSVELLNQYAYIVRQDYDTRFVEILDVSDPAAPWSEGVQTPESRHGPMDIVVQDQLAYLNGLFYTIDIVDLTNPVNPQVISSVETPGFVNQYVVDGDYVYVADSFNVSVIDVSNPASPKVVGFFDIAGAAKIAKVGDYLYVNGQTRRGLPELHILEFQP